MQNILYENDGCYVVKTAKGYEVFAPDATYDSACVRRRASIGEGPGPQLGFERAKSECDEWAEG
jgi:hypothetical protein